MAISQRFRSCHFPRLKVRYFSASCLLAGSYVILSTYSRRNSQGIPQRVTAISRYTRDICAGSAGLDAEPN